MAGVPEKVLNWLYSVLPSEYTDVHRTYHDVAETLSTYSSLSPRTDVYTYESGASALLLQLSGTIAVQFRGQTFGFPIAIWVPHAYPREPPIVYVTPSPDMIARPGQHVSGDGRVYHPYLAQWAKYWDKSTLYDFLAVLKGVFAKEPPVRSRASQPQYNLPAAQAPPPVPPPPSEWRRSMQGAQTASPSPGPLSGAPPPPPKPPKPYEQGRPTPQPQSQHDRYLQAPPLPPHPAQQTPQHQDQYQQPQRNHNWQQQGPPHPAPRQTSYNMSPATPIAKPPRPHVQSQNYPPQSYGIESPVSPITPEDQQSASRHYQHQAPQQPHPSRNSHSQHYQRPPSQQVQQYGPPPVQPPHQQGPPQHYPPQQYAQHQQQQPPQQPSQPTVPPPNLMDMDSLEVTLPSQRGSQQPLHVPPVPPNPEKDAVLHALSSSLTAQIRQTVSQNHAAVAPLQAQQFALRNAYARLQSELDQLQQLDAALASNEQILHNAMKEADRVMWDARRRKAPDVDDVLVAPTVVGGQLYAVAAEERGISEALFVLGRALDRGKIGADVFVKQTRALAREQFLKKALGKKIARGMGLDEYGMR
ncbi:hypothetical protein PMIN04_002209 [Paraphaeosphaeria minitans]